MTSQPSETSPLLPKPKGDAPTTTPATGVVPQDVAPPVENEQDGGDIERQTSNGDSIKHQGLPEVKKRLKYIFPAIAIGVRIAPQMFPGYIITKIAGLLIRR
jgi:hypothetical protein